MEQRWLLYGANGYTGRLVIEHALARGHRPVLAGRDAAALRALAAPAGLEWRALGLDDAAALDRALADIALVYHVAGPFTQTAAPMREACLRTGTHYVDVTGESPVTRDTLQLDRRARDAGVLMLPSSGVNTVPTDSIALYASSLLPGATRLEVAIDTVRRQSSGSLVSMLEVSSLKGQVRRRGEVVEADVPLREVRFPGGLRHCIALPLADLYTGWETTGIADITACVAQDRLAANLLRHGAPLMRRLFSHERLRQRTQALLRRHVQGPDAGTRAGDRTWAWARVADAAGRSAEAWLETCEGYTFTAAVAPWIVEAALASDRRGATTVAAAFGADFVLQVPGTRRLDRLPG